MQRLIDTGKKLVGEVLNIPDNVFGFKPLPAIIWTVLAAIVSVSSVLLALAMLYKGQTVPALLLLLANVVFWVLTFFSKQAWLSVVILFALAALYVGYLVKFLIK